LRFRLICDRLAQPTVRPSADLLLIAAVQALAVGHVAHIPDRDRAGQPFHGVVHDGAADFMLSIADAAALFGAHLRFTPLQLPPAARAFLFLGLRRRQALHHWVPDRASDLDWRPGICDIQDHNHNQRRPSRERRRQYPASVRANAVAEPVTVLYIGQLLPAQTSAGVGEVVRRFITEARTEHGTAVPELSQPYTMVVGYTHFTEFALVASTTRYVFLPLAVR